MWLALVLGPVGGFLYSEFTFSWLSNLHDCCSPFSERLFGGTCLRRVILACQADTASAFPVLRCIVMICRDIEEDMPFAPSSFSLLVVRHGAPSSVLPPSSDALLLVAPCS